MSKCIIRCPVCEWSGEIKTLGEYQAETGIVSVRRSRGMVAGDNTIITGNDFQIICGRCGEVAFQKIPVTIQETISLTLPL